MAIPTRPHSCRISPAIRGTKSWSGTWIESGSTPSLRSSKESRSTLQPGRRCTTNPITCPSSPGRPGSHTASDRLKAPARERPLAGSALPKQWLEESPAEATGEKRDAGFNYQAAIGELQFDHSSRFGTIEYRRSFQPVSRRIGWKLPEANTPKGARVTVSISSDSLQGRKT